MGTNFYLRRDVCEKCGRGDEPLHIGKSSAGWCFSLHVSRPGDSWDNTPKDLAEWRQRWTEHGVRIEDEYGQVVSPAFMEDRILRRGPGRGDMTGAWLAANGAILGPNGLARHAIGRHCIGHGEGTYDLIFGEFS